MISLPKLLLIALVIVVVWFVLRALNRPPERGAPRRARPEAPRRRIQAEDLVPCAGCGAYVATTARRCGRATCPLPR